MNQVILLILELLPTVIKSITDDQTIAKLVDLVQQITPTLMQEYADVAPSLKNIINALQSNDAVTDAQWDALDALSTQIDAAFEDAAQKAQAEDK